MLAQILTGKLSVKQAAQSASDNIASVLNQSVGQQELPSELQHDRRRRDALGDVSAAVAVFGAGLRAVRSRTR